MERQRQAGGGAGAAVDAVLSGSRSWHVQQGHVLDSLRALPDGCVSVCCTSPPYFQLRSYLKNGDPLKRHELGQERTPAEYVQNMVEVFREVRRVLHPTGCLFLNVGDSYAGSGKGPSNSLQRPASCLNDPQLRGGAPPTEWVSVPKGLKSKDLIGVPWELAFALRADGWWLRSEITWIKTSCMPESVSGWRWERHKIKTGSADAHEAALQAKMAELGADRNRAGLDARTERGPLDIWADCPGCDQCAPNDGLVLRKGSGRPTSATESVFLLAAGDPYYYDTEAVKTESTVGGGGWSRVYADQQPSHGGIHSSRPDASAGANARNYLILGPEPLRDEHYAAFPTAIPEFCIKAGSSERGVCSGCGSPWARVVEREPGVAEAQQRPKVGPGGYGSPTSTLSLSGNGSKEWAERGAKSATTGWRPTCRCSAGLLPSLVLDPFCGSGTSGVVALRLGRRFLGLELNPTYVQMARRRIQGDCPLFNSQELPA